MSYEPPFERTSRIDALCMGIAELVGMVSLQASIAKSPTLHRQLRIKTIHSSLLIEGNKLSERAVTAILDGKRVLGDPSDILEVENAKRAYDMLESLDPGSIDDLLRAHGVMMKGLVPEAGRFRCGNVGVFDGERLIHAGTPAAYVPEVVADLFGWLRSTSMHPLLASCIFHFEFEFIHPFSDGNGRTGRLWHTLILSRWRPILAWLPIESGIRSRQAEYYAALAESDAVGSSERFVEFMLEVIKESILPFVEVEGSKDAEHALTLTRALVFFRENPKGSVSALACHLGCSKRTAERVVAELKAQGTLSREGSARAGCWVVGNNRS